MARKNMKTAEFTGFLTRKLSEAYANIDVFLFPSETDAFGNVIQEANASGVPAIVTDQGGPKFIVRTAKPDSSPRIWLNFTNSRSSF
jgi:glycosyltransferase involved in cell wall biosynthesis